MEMAALGHEWRQSNPDRYRAFLRCLGDDALVIIGNRSVIYAPAKNLGLIGVWVMYGLAMVLFTAGVQKIPQSLYDAARMDGAGPVREFFAVTLPGLRNEIAVALTLTTIQALRSFDLVYITTGGGPGDSTSVPAFEVYNRAFRGGDVGTAAAIGVCIAALIFVLTVGINRIAEREAAR